MVTLNGLLPHEELEIPRHPGEEHMEKMILHQLEASPGLGLGWEWGIWSFGFGVRGGAQVNVRKRELTVRVRVRVRESVV